MKTDILSKMEGILSNALNNKPCFCIKCNCILKVIEDNENLKIDLICENCGNALKIKAK